MPPATVDPDFVAPLKINVTGIYFNEVERFSPEEIEREFRKAVQDPALAGDNRFLFNLMFLVRKREVRSLLPDVQQVLGRGGLDPLAEVSTLKTLFALGSVRERALADDRVSRALESELASGSDLLLSPFFDAAERIGGPRTLETLRRGSAESQARQAQAERSAPQDHVRISRLDKIRAGFEDRGFTLARKLQVLAFPDVERASELASLYLQRAGHLSFWGWKELVDHPGQPAFEGVFTFVVRRAEELLPLAGISPEQRSELLFQYRLRGLCLLERMGAPLGPAEQKYLADQAALIQEHVEFYRPSYDWEDVLDQH